MNNHLYLYINKPNNVMEEGILTPFLVPEEYYLNSPFCKRLLNDGKIDKITKNEYLKRICDHFGNERLHSILVLTEPVSKYCPKIINGKLKNFIESRELFELPSYEKLKELQLVSTLVERCGKNIGSLIVQNPDYSEIDWKSIDPETRGFGGIRHYQVTLTNDKIPIEYVKKCSFLYKEDM